MEGSDDSSGRWPSGDSGIGQRGERLAVPRPDDELGEPGPRRGAPQDQASFVTDGAAAQILAGEA